MKLSLIAALCSISFGLFACASSDQQSAESDVHAAAPAPTLTCAVVNGQAAKLALVPTAAGKAALLSLQPAGALFALGGTNGTLNGTAFSSSTASLTLDANLKGTWKQGSASARVTCAAADANDAASWAAANALLGYAGEIDGLAQTVVDEMNGLRNRDSSASRSRTESPKPYTIFVVETAKRDTLDLGTKVNGSAGALPAGENNSGLDDNDWSYGGMSAAYGLGGGRDYGEWFQGASDGISLQSDVTAALGTARAGYIAHEKVAALSDFVDHAKPSAIELTVGKWTFFMPDAFAK